MSAHILQWFTPDEFRNRRERVYDAIGNSLAVLQGAPEPPAFELFRQTNEFLYLSGLEAPHAYLVLDGRSRKATAYLPHRPQRWDDPRATWFVEDAERIGADLGLDAVAPLESLAARLLDTPIVFTPHAPAEGARGSRDVAMQARRSAVTDPWDGDPGREARFVELVRSRSPRTEIRDLSPILDKMRLIKSEAEIAVMRRCGQLSAAATVAAMRRTRAGLGEQHLHAEMARAFLEGGARREGYRAVIPAGTEHIRNGHYPYNDGPLNDGDLILMDCAPEIANYTSDIGRMWPVSGRFDSAQRQLYGFMVEYHRVLLSLIRPVTKPRDVLAEASTRMKPVADATPWACAEHRAAAERALDFTGHLSHPVGMAVHDVGSYFEHPLAAGLVFSVDPQMWVPEQGLYIRVEDTGVVTSSGFESFTSDAPIDLDETEALVGHGL